MERAIENIAGSAAGRVGVSVVHLESGRSAFLNATEAFPMASSYKVAIAIALLTRVDRRELRLDSLVVIDSTDLHPGSGTVSDLLAQPGVALSLRNLLELMMLISDNSATDVVLRVVGGPDAVNARLRELGIQGMNISRPTIRLVSDYWGVRETITPASRFLTVRNALSRRSQDSAHAAFQIDPRDTTTPQAMASLISKIWRREAISPPSTDLLIDIMRRCRTGTNRLRGFLPPGVDVADKTGTMGGDRPTNVNDVGVFTLPDNGGHVVVAAYIKAATPLAAESERVIANIGRAVYDYFLFNP
ncbi:MAG: class A beta-lactamase [Gemmatimonadetes bacterium]|nr:class A beta-lactamase [Gemmatimonadota bacterium]